MAKVCPTKAAPKEDKNPTTILSDKVSPCALPIRIIIYTSLAIKAIVPKSGATTITPALAAAHLQILSTSCSISRSSFSSIISIQPSKKIPSLSAILKVKGML